MEFGRHAVLRGQFAFASTGSSPVGRTKYMPYVQAGEEAVLKTVGRKRLAGSNPADLAKLSSNSTVRVRDL